MFTSFKITWSLLPMQVGTWSRWLTDLFGMDVDDSLGEVQINGEDGESQGGHDEPKSFHLLNALSDLLMLPKDMLMDRSIRKEVSLIIIYFHSRHVIFPCCSSNLMHFFGCHVFNMKGVPINQPSIA